LLDLALRTVTSMSSVWTTTGPRSAERNPAAQRITALGEFLVGTHQDHAVAVSHHDATPLLLSLCMQPGRDGRNTRLGPADRVAYDRATRLEPDFSATDGTADVSEDEEDDADDEHDRADRVEETDTGQPTDQQK
jgi:hypothetical protein